MQLMPALITRVLWYDLLKSCAFVTLCLVALQMVFNMLGESSNLKNNYTFLDSVFYSLLMSGPGSLVFILPIVVLISTLLVLGRMSDNSELIVLQTSGLSKFSLFSKLLPIALFVCITVMILEDIAFLPLRNFAIDMRNELRGTNQGTSGSLAIKQGNQFLIAEKIASDGALSETNVFTYDDDFHLISHIFAKQGQANDQFITLELPLINRYNQTTPQILENEQKTNAEKQRFTQLASLDFQTNHSKRFLYWLARNNLTDTARLSFSELWEFASFQHTLNPRNNQFLQVFYNKLMLPFNILAFMLLVLPFVFGSTRAMNTSTKVIIAIMVGLVFINFQQLTLPIHVVFGLHPLLVAATPGVLTLAIAYGLMKIQQ